jgi:hypothetical protein
VDEDKKDLLNLLSLSCNEYSEGCAMDFKLKDGAYRAVRRDESHRFRDLMTALAVCNNVTPVPQVQQVPEMLRKENSNSP